MPKLEYFCDNSLCINHVKVNEDIQYRKVLYPDGVKEITRRKYKTLGPNRVSEEYYFCESCVRMFGIVEEINSFGYILELGVSK